MSLIKALGWTIAAGGMFALAGCSSAPIPLSRNFESTTQHKVRAAGHWELLARDVAARTRATLEKAGYDARTPMHVAPPASATAFDFAFREFLITEMVQSGAAVHQQPGAELSVTYQSQVVRHNSDRPYFIPGQFTMLAAGLIAAYGLRHEHLDAKLLAGVGLTAAADYANSVASGGPTNTELILTTTVAREGRYLSRTTDVYYLENADAPLFLPLPPVVNMKVISQ